MAIENLALKAVGLGVSLLLLRLIFSFVTHPLRDIPGPFWAKFTNLWRMLDYWQCTQIESHRELHRTLGPAVRIGPNMVSLSDPDLLKQVYSIRGDFLKVCCQLCSFVE